MGEQQLKKSDTCEMCGGQYVFDPLLQCMKCSFCGNIRQVKTTTNHIAGFDVMDMGNYSHSWDVERKTIICQNCGGKTTTGQNDIIAYCIYCGSGHILTKDDQDLGMRPKSILPFCMNQEKAKQLFHDWGMDNKGIGFDKIPKSYFEKYQMPELKGVYMPYWSFEIDAQVTWHKDMSTYFPESIDGEAKTIHKSGSYTKEYCDVIIPGFKSKYLTYIDIIEAFDFTEIRDYQGSYLSGYYAEKYVVEPNDALMEAVEKIKAEIEVNEDVDGIKTNDHWHFVDFDYIKYNLYLLPFYMASFTYKGKIYFVAINGQTGEIAGGDATKKRKQRKYSWIDYLKKQISGNK